MNITKKVVRRGRWSVGELARLKEVYGVRQEQVIARELGRPIDSVRKMAERMFRGPKRTGPWTAQEVEGLKRFVGVSSPSTIARILRRPENEVSSKIASLGKSRRGGKWTLEDTQQLKNLYGSRSDSDLAIILGRPEVAIRKQATVLRLAKDKVFLSQLTGARGRMPRWNKSEEQALRSLYKDHSNLEIAKILGKTVKSIVSKAHDLQLKKNSDRLEEMGRENVSLRRDRS